MNWRDLTSEEIESMLEVIPPAGDYPNWVRIMLACIDAGVSYSAFDRWSRQSGGYNEADNQRRWNENSGKTPEGVGALYNLATKEYKWQDPRIKESPTGTGAKSCSYTKPAAASEPPAEPSEPAEPPEPPRTPKSVSLDALKQASDHQSQPDTDNAQNAQKPRLTLEQLKIAKEYPKEPDGAFPYYRKPAEWNAEAQKHTSDPEFLKWLESRGIDGETAKRFSIGFIPRFYKAHRNSKDNPTVYECEMADRVVIPYPDSDYMTARVACNARYCKVDALTKARLSATDDGEPEKYLYPLSRDKEIFNTPALGADSETIYVVEGQVDAITFDMAGYRAVGVNEAKLFKETLDKLKEGGQDFTGKVFVIVPDNDLTGRVKAGRVRSALKELRIKSCTAQLPDGINDINEYWVKNREAAKEWLAQTDKTARRSLIGDILKNGAETHLETLVEHLKDKAWNQPIPTGFPRLDVAMEGGLYAGLFVIGADTSMGKTAFTMQLADQMAAAGNDVFCFETEMSAEELICRSVSRLTMTASPRRNDWKTGAGILVSSRYDGYSKTEMSIIRQSFEKYQQTIAPHLFIVEGMGTLNYEIIEDTVRRYVHGTGRTPVVFVDYLQLLQPPEQYINGHASMSERQVVDLNLMGLKRMSRDLHCVVWCVSSVSRQNAKKEFEITDFKESGGVEYTADAAFGLQLQGMKKGFDIHSALRQDPRKIELKCLKNRRGKREWSVCYDYFPAFNCFTEEDIEADVFQSAPTAEPEPDDDGQTADQPPKARRAVNSRYGV